MGIHLLKTIQIAIATLVLGLAGIGASLVIGLIESKQAIAIAVNTSKVIVICLVALVVLFAIFSLGAKSKRDI